MIRARLLYSFLVDFVIASVFQPTAVGEAISLQLKDCFGTKRLAMTSPLGHKNIENYLATIILLKFF
jgi:hypothetical protein